MSEAMPAHHPSTLPSVTGPSNPHPISILLINPNSTASMTQSCLTSLASSTPPFVTVYGFTAPHPSPSAIEGQVDAILSSEVCLRALRPVLAHYDAFLVACFSAHPLIPALREEVSHQPVIGIMEAALYASRMCGGCVGVVATSQRSKIMHAQSIGSVYGLDAFSVGCEAADLGVLELESRPRTEVDACMADAAMRLVAKGADCVCLGCAGMTGMKEACERAVQLDERRVVLIVDGVGIGVHFLAGLVRERMGTAKGGIYKSAARGREARGQTWY